MPIGHAHSSTSKVRSTIFMCVASEIFGTEQKRKILKMSAKSKGINAERELIHLFWNSGWAAIRVAGSGNSQFPSPDLVAGNIARKLAIECKALKGEKKYLSEEDISQIKEFSSKFGSETWFAVRFNKQKWFFLRTEDLEKTRTGYAVSLELAKQKGLIFEELISV